MSRIVVVGGGVAGLASCLTLSRQGHDITLFERDELPIAANPHDAFDLERRGAPQVRHSHAFLARLRNLLRDEYPEVLAALYGAGATDLRFADGLPDTLTNYAPQDDDADLTLLACRRTTFEWILRRMVVDDGRVTIIGGTDVTGLTSTSAGYDRHDLPTVTGVQLSSGANFAADLTIVASGRRGALPTWLHDIGAGDVNEIVDDTGIVYFSRFYRLREGHQLPPRTGPIGGDLGYLKYGVFPGDNGTFSLTLAASTEDAAVRKALDDNDTFDAAGRALTFTAAYLDGRAEPITPVHKIAGLISRWRDYVVNGRPLAIGVLPVGDAHLATNPLYGRGCTTAFVSAHLLSMAIAQHQEPEAIAVAHEAAVRAELRPWVMSTMQTDADARRVASAIINGEDPDGDPNDPRTLMRAVFRDGLRPAMRTDAHVLRKFIRNFNLLTPPDTLASDPDFATRVLAAFQEREQRAPEPHLGPPRHELLELIGSAA
jgi:2-polyprenyl-6-methoxyphenol hydroxylase-like FAD-dependent oxidoreductase